VPWTQDVAMPGPEDKITDSPRIVPQRDDRPARASAKGKRGSAPPPPPKNGGGGGGGRGGWLVGLVAFLALLAGGAGVALGMSLQREVLDLRAELTASEARVAQLELVLSTTGADITESANTMQEKIDLLMSEVDKLWASAWRRNRDRLDGQEESINALKTQVAGVASNKTRIEQIAKANDELKAQIGAARQAASALEDIRTQQGLQEAMIGRLNRELDNLTSRQAGIDQRLKDAEGWVESNIEFRKQVQRRLLELEGGAPQ
jgi:DNA repair exonuclease SbcCD ATPase subunit